MAIEQRFPLTETQTQLSTLTYMIENFVMNNSAKTTKKHFALVVL